MAESLSSCRGTIASFLYYCVCGEQVDLLEKIYIFM